LEESSKQSTPFQWKKKGQRKEESSSDEEEVEREGQGG
jgi:hypothetical protein